MHPRFQADENLNAQIVAGLRRREPALDFQTAQAAGILSLADPVVLAYSAREGRILVSHDRETMPAHFHRFIAGSTSAGLLIVPQKLGIGKVIDQIILIWAATDANEWTNWIDYLPL